MTVCESLAEREILRFWVCARGKERVLWEKASVVSKNVRVCVCFCVCVHECVCVCVCAHDLSGLEAKPGHAREAAANAKNMAALHWFTVTEGLTCPDQQPDRRHSCP